MVELDRGAAFGLWRGIGFVLVGAAVGRAARRDNAWRVARAGAWARVVALVIAPFNAPAGLALYGAASASVPASHPLLVEDHERHRVLARLGNVAAPLIVAALATALSTRATFLALACISAAAALRLRGAALTQAPPVDEAFRVRNRVALVFITIAVIAEMPVHLAVFSHLGALGLTVPALALIAATAELTGVIANIALRDHSPELLRRSRGQLLAMVAGTGAVGLVSVYASVHATTVLGALTAITVGAIAASAAIPFLTVGTRAVIAGEVAPGFPLVAAGALALVPGIGVVCAGVTAVASAVVAKVTPEERMREVAGGLN